MIAHDIYAETNPAWVAYVLVSFLRGFAEMQPEGVELPVVYLGLPICLSGDLALTFMKTNKRTGLREWLERSPQVQLDLAERLNDSLGIVTSAVKFGCFAGTLTLDRHARLLPGTLHVKGELGKGLSSDLSAPVKHADRLGYWFGMAGSTKTAFDILGLSL